MLKYIGATIQISMAVCVLLSCSSTIKCVATSIIDLDPKENEVTYNTGDTLSLIIEMTNSTDSMLTIPINEGCFWLDIEDSGTTSEHDFYERSIYYNIRMPGSDSTIVIGSGERKGIVLYFVEVKPEYPRSNKMTIGTYRLVYGCANLCEGGYVAFIGDAKNTIKIIRQ